MALRKAEEKKVDVAEMSMFRYICGITKLDRMRSDTIRLEGTIKCREGLVEDKERRLKQRT